MTQLKTVQDPMKLLSSTNFSSNISTSSDLPTTTQPSTPTLSPTYIVVPSSSLNYLKIVPLLSTGSNSPIIRVTGYTKTSDATTMYVPQLLFSGSISAVSSTTVSVNSQNFNTATTITKTLGDAKIYNATSIASTGFILVDTLGCQWIKIEFLTTTTATTCNAFIGAI